MVFHWKVFKLQSYISVSLNLSVKPPNSEVKLNVKPTKIQIWFNKKSEWFSHKTSEPNGFRKDFMDNQLKLMFSKKDWVLISELLQHLYTVLWIVYLKGLFLMYYI